MENSAPQRLIKDFATVVQDLTLGVCVAPENNNFLVWNGVIFGPRGTPYEEGTFKIRVEFTNEYPSKPPTVRFVSRMFHPNIDVNGDISMDIVDNKWSPNHDVAFLLKTIRSLLKEPNLSLPVNVEAAASFANNRMEYDRKVRETVQWSWMNSPDNDCFENESENQYEDDEEDEEELLRLVEYCLKHNHKLYDSTNN